MERIINRARFAIIINFTNNIYVMRRIEPCLIKQAFIGNTRSI